MQFAELVANYLPAQMLVVARHIMWDAIAGKQTNTLAFVCVMIAYSCLLSQLHHLPVVVVSGAWSMFNQLVWLHKLRTLNKQCHSHMYAQTCAWRKCIVKTFQSYGCVAACCFHSEIIISAALADKELSPMCLGCLQLLEDRFGFILALLWISLDYELVFPTFIFNGNSDHNR